MISAAPIARRIAELEGFVRGFKRDTSEAAQEERATLEAAWKALARKNRRLARLDPLLRRVMRHRPLTRHQPVLPVEPEAPASTRPSGPPQ